MGSDGIGVEEGAKPHVLFVGAFPKRGRQVFGGNVTDCIILLQSSFSKRLRLTLVDSTQISNPPPSFIVRLLLSIRRLIFFVFKFEISSPDVVLLFMGSGTSVMEKGAMAWYVHLRGVRVCVFPRGGGLLKTFEKRNYVPKWIRLALMPADYLLCQGHAWKNFAVRGLGRNPLSAPIVPSWTATPQLLDVGASRSAVSHRQPVRILFVGWVERSKGVFELIEAISGLERETFHLDIVGHGHAYNAVRRQVTESKLESHVTFSGWRKADDLVEHYRKADIFVLPSWVEGLPNAMIEAMAAGLCVVVTPVGNILDVIRDGENGIVVPVQNPISLRNALENLIQKPELRIALSSRASEDARLNFSVEPAVEALIRALTTTINPARDTQRQ